jgi:hypothetical protein
MSDSGDQEHVPYPSVAIIHLSCGGIAFRVDHRPKIGEPMTASSVVWPLGVKDGDDVVCAECGGLCAGADLIPEGYVWAE